MAYPSKIKLNNHRSKESEEALIASVITDSNQIGRVTSIVKTEMFYSKFNQVLWGKIISMHNNGTKIDLTTVTSQMKNNTDVNFDNKNSTFIITGYFDHMSSPSNSVQYAKNIYEKYELRKISDLSIDLDRSIGTDNIKTVDALTKVHRKITNILSVHGDDKFH